MRTAFTFNFTSKRPQRGKYLMQNYPAVKAFTFLDFLLKIFIKNPKTALPSEPKSILISNLAHMGDVLMMTALLAVLKEKLPHARLGVLIGSWSYPIVENHPFVDKIHIIDHWKLNRSPISKWQKLIRYYKSKMQAVKEIKAAGYEIAVDSYFFYPNAISTLWKSKIPIRLGYTSGGFGPLLTHSFDWTNYEQSIIYYYLPLLNCLGIMPEQALKYLRPSLHLPKNSSGVQLLQEKLNRDVSKGYLVIHIGTGLSVKEWPIDKWQCFVPKLRGYTLIFTGKGSEEKSKVERIIGQNENCYNLVDNLKWNEYLAVIKDADLLVGVDSLAGHLAAALDVPAVLIFSGISNLHHWTPLSKRNKILTKQVTCSPCYQKRGCSSMRCIREISVEDLHNACVEALKKPMRKVHLPFF